MHIEAPLRGSRNWMFPEIQSARVRIADLEAENRELSTTKRAIASDARDRLDNERIAVILAVTLETDSNCVDVGCHEGSILADMVRLAPTGRHIAFEPIPYLFASLLERFPTVDVRQTALADRSGTAEFKHVKDLPGYSGLRERRYPRAVDIETIAVTTERLDDVVPAGWIPTLIKIDVEGAEQLVIEGGLATICAARPTIIFEHGPGASDHYGSGPADIHALLHGEAGLRIYDLDGRGPYSLSEFEEEYAKGKRWQWVAHR
jgi:FkbM family methyltransferase